MIAHTIQLALAPVFVLVAIGNILNLLSTRLGRVVDRARKLQERHTTTSGIDHDMIVQEMRLLDKRIVLIGHAIRLLVLCALFVGTTVALLFVQEMVQVNFQQVAAVTFLAALALLMVALILFLRETQVSAAALRIPRDFLELHRDL